MPGVPRREAIAKPRVLQQPEGIAARLCRVHKAEQRWAQVLCPRPSLPTQQMHEC